MSDLLPYGVTPSQYRVTQSWAVRKERYAATSGFTPEELEARRARAKQLGARKAQRLTCRRGHRWTPQNTLRWPSRPQVRTCKACHLIREGGRQRRGYRRVSDVSREQLAAARARLIDVGIKANQQPSSRYWRRRFLAARRRYNVLKRTRTAT